MEGVSRALGNLSKFEDRRMDGFLMASPQQLLAVIALYLLFIYKIGPKFMDKREAFSLKPLIIVYNICQIAGNLYIFMLCLKSITRLSLLCTHPTHKLITYESSTELQAHYYYTLLKYCDFTETIFFVLRKKRRQISYLHVHHHVGILVAAWISCRYFPGGQAVYVGLYNSFIHAIMYSYYLLTAWNSEYTHMWWKKYITLLQIIQHCMIFLSTFPSVVNVSCSYPKWVMGLFDVNVVLIIYLFAKFYRQNYLRNKKNE